MTDWQAMSWEVINDTDQSIPSTATLQERAKAIRDAYPFGERKFHPYKVWLKAQRAYLARFRKSSSDINPAHLTPLEKLLENNHG